MIIFEWKHIENVNKYFILETVNYLAIRQRPMRMRLRE